MKYTFSFLFLFSIFFSFSQNKEIDSIRVSSISTLKTPANIFIDENLIKISSIVYKNKCKNEMLKCLEVQTKDTLINVIYKKFNFGKLSKHSNERIRKEIYRDKKYDGTVIIHYAYNLKSIDDYVKEQKRACSNSKSVDPKIQKYRIIEKSKIRSSKVNKCVKKYKKKYNADVLHYNFEGDRATSLSPDIDWIKDKNQIIKNYFFKYVGNYHLVIIKSDGQFLQIGSLVPPRSMKKLLKEDDWSKYIEDLKKSEKARKKTDFFDMDYTNNCL